MLLPRKWALGLGLLIAAPSLSVAGPLDLRGNPSKSAAAAQTSDQTNQQVADDIGATLQRARLVHKNVQIEYANGVATIRGQIKDNAQRALVTRLVGKVSGVQTVQNELELMQPGAPQPGPFDQPIQQAAGQMHGGEKRVQQVAFTEQAPTSNQEVAQRIADSLTSAGLSGYDIEIRYKAGIASLIGSVEDKEQVARAERACSSVPGVNQVVNQLSVKGRPVDIRQAGAQQPGFAPQMPPQMPPHMAAQMPPQGHPVQQTAAQYPTPGTPPAPVMGPPQYGHVQPASHQIYNQPNMPQYAWPTYAPYDNSAAITYPSNYDASAWPYIGPYYPYPQVPLGWRSSTLEWDDGSWNLKFSSRTDRWWWFLNPHNWH